MFDIKDDGKCGSNMYCMYIHIYIYIHNHTYVRILNGIEFILPFLVRTFDHIGHLHLDISENAFIMCINAYRSKIIIPYQSI